MKLDGRRSQLLRMHWVGALCKLTALAVWSRVRIKISPRSGSPSFKMNVAFDADCHSLVPAENTVEEGACLNEQIPSSFLAASRNDNAASFARLPAAR
jgi:hypothetical protein